MATRDDKDDDESEREDEESERDEEESERDESSVPEAFRAEEPEAEADVPASRESEAPKSSVEREAAELAKEARALAEEGPAPVVQMGTARYVHAAFFTATIIIGFVSSKILGLVWGSLADWPAATRQVPFLLRYAEDERNTYVLVAGGLIGLVTIIQVYRREKIRRWADEVALELSKVSWPNRETVTNGTVVVIVASLIATVYVGLLDRFWSFLTHLVYGA
jgi:preprotein translocase subunit SecE